MNFVVDVNKNDDNATCFYTGLTQYSHFTELLKPLVPKKRDYLSHLSLIDKFFRVLIKLQLGVPHQDIAFVLMSQNGL